MHALLKSGRHSDGIFVSKILLAHNNILQLVARQMATVLRRLEVFPDYVVGVPDGATKLGEAIAHALGTSILPMKKVEGRTALSLGILVILQIFLGLGAFGFTIMMEPTTLPRTAEVFFTTAHQTVGALILATGVVLTLLSFKRYPYAATS